MSVKQIANLICTAVVLLSFFNSSNLRSQSAISTGVPFLLIAPNSRFGGMGETGAALADDASAMYWNPSGLAFQNKGSEINVTHSPWLAGLGSGDLFYDYFAGRKYIKSINGTVGVSLTYLNIGEIIVSNEIGEEQQSQRYNAFEMAFALGYATKLSDSWAGGFSAKFIYSKLTPNNFHVGEEKGSGTAYSACIDISGKFMPSNGSDFFANKFSFGFNISNIGPEISYVDGDQSDPLPALLRIGISYKLINSEFNSLVIASDFAKLLVNRIDPFYKSFFSSWKGGVNEIARSFQTSIGAEYWYGSPKMFAFRAGYFYEDPSYGNRKYYTLGAGIRYDLYGFDFSYINTIEENHPLANTLKFGLVLNF